MGNEEIGGYEFNRHFAAEVMTLDLGTTRDQPRATSSTIGGFGVPAVGTFPMHRWRFSGHFGALSGDGRTSERSVKRSGQLMAGVAIGFNLVRGGRNQKSTLMAQSHEALAAFFRSAEFDWRATITEASRALERNPTLDQSHSFLAAAFMHLGLLDRANSEARKVMDLNQANLGEPLRIQGAAAMYAGRYDEAVALLKRASEASTFPAEWNLAYASYYAGRQAEAEDMLRKVRGNSARSQRRTQATLASFLAARGETAEAKRLIDGILAGSYMDHHVAYSLGAAFAQLDMPDEAVRWLSQSRKDGFPCYPWFGRDPLLAKLKQHPAFQAFYDDLKRAWDTTKEQYPER